jgi:23S rRNA (cytidine1920-2'-O)/16S rRNA (cytidine1409-2'-O)-methyltransferase
MLVERKLALSREKAQALVLAGKVRVEGQPAGKSGRMVSTVSHLEVLSNDQPCESGRRETKSRS